METGPRYCLLQRTEKDVKYMSHLYGIDDEKIVEEKLEALLQWMKSENHLVEASKYMYRPYLKNLFLLAKCSIEVTKRKIDKLLTIKALMPEMFQKNHIDEFNRILEIVCLTILPKVCPTDRSRITVAKFLTDNLDDFNILSLFRYITVLAEYRVYNDFTIHERLILDLTNVSLLTLITKLNPVAIKKIDLISETFGIKIKGIHIISKSTYIDKLVAILKQTLRAKVASRLHVHLTYEDLHKHIPKEIIPKDFGGDEKSCQNVAELWKEELRTTEVKNLFEQLRNLVSNESKRSSYTFNEEYMGMPGSFRQLSVD